MKKNLVLAISLLAATLAASSFNVPQARAAESIHVYAVTNVAPDDNLNMRSGPGVNSSVVASIPANGQGIVATGEEKKVGNSTWVKVYWAGTPGWINKFYLREDVQTSSYDPGSNRRPSSGGKITMRCGGTEPFWDINITEGQMNVNMMDGPRYSVPVTFRQTSANNRTIAVIAGANTANSTQAFLQKVNACSDGMSDNNYPYSVTAVLNNQKVVSGCCKVVQQ